MRRRRLPRVRRRVRLEARRRSLDDRQPLQALQRLAHCAGLGAHTLLHEIAPFGSDRQQRRAGAGAGALLRPLATEQPVDQSALCERGASEKFSALTS